MCGRYWLPDEEAGGEIRNMIEELGRRGRKGEKEIKRSGEVFPTDLVPVLANNRNMQPAVFAMEWGYTLPDGRRIINARSETAHEKGMFRDGLKNRRCLIPAGHYCEWETQGKEKIRYDICGSEEEEMYMAGLYRMEGEKAVFTILTRAAAPDIAFIHERMPVILRGKAKRDWLDLNCDAGEVMKAAETAVRFKQSSL